MVLNGILVGAGSVTLATALFYPFKLRAKKESAAALFKVFVASALVRLVFLAGIAVWGFKYAPVSGLAAIVSFGILFIVFSFFEIHFLRKK